MNLAQAQIADHKKEMLLGSDAVANGVKLCHPEVIAAYPITPQTHIVETLSQMVLKGEMNCQYIHAESEMSAIAACFGAVASGSRAFTATSSHGLALMHEMLHWFSGSRFPMVMVNANRAIGGPWNIWTDQSDSLSQRDTGWLQIYCETAQEALDNIILAYWLSEKIMLPVMVMIDGFILSHTMEPLFIPEQKLVDEFLPAYTPPYRLNTYNPLSFGAPTTADNFYHLKKSLDKAMKTVPKILVQGYDRFNELFGRHYTNVESYNLEGADTVIFCSGSLTGTAREAVDKLRKQNYRVGLIKLRLFRPFPQKKLTELLRGKKEIIVLNRADSFGAGGTLSQDERAAFYPITEQPVVYDVVASLGGKEVFPETIIEIVNNSRNLSDKESNWL